MIPAQRVRKTAFWLGLALPMFALLATVWVTRVTNGQFSAAFDSVTHTYNVLNILEQTQAHVADAEMGQRGYFLTGRTDYYSLYDTAMAAINNDIQNLKILVGGNPAQETNLVELQTLISRRLGTNSPASSRTRPTDASAVALTDQGRDTISQIRNVIFQMREQQTSLLVIRQQSAEARFLFDETVSLVLIGITAVALIAIVTVVLRLEYLQRFVTVCAWTGQVQSGGKWINLDEYLKQRFGVSVSHGLSNEAAARMVQEMQQTRPPAPPKGPVPG